MKYYRFLLVAVFLGISVFAYAGKPDSEYRLSSPDMHGKIFECIVRNVSDRSITPTITFFDAEGTIVEQHDATEFVAGRAYYDTSEATSGIDIQNCSVTWVGQKEDFTATFCAFYGVGRTESMGCFELL